jgi:hypothetical protein
MAIRTEHAECSKHCFDEDCPYTHYDVYWVIRETDEVEIGPFRTKEEAIEENKKYLLPE